ncbi:MAG: porin [Planctomycetota bacterium]|nr:porin [Planctomycetota bacterium]
MSRFITICETLCIAGLVLLLMRPAMADDKESAGTYTLSDEIPISNAPADDASPIRSGLEYEQLIERLEQAERRIQFLEGDQNSSTNETRPDIETVSAKIADGEPTMDPTAERVTKLEGLFKNLEEGQKAFVLPGHSGATMKIVGRIHLDYWGFPDTDPGINAFETGDPNTPVQDNFQFRRLRFGVRGDINPNMEYRIEMEFAGGNDSEFRDAYFAFKNLPFVQTLVIGNQKRPYGLDHWNSSRYNVFLERPFFVESVNQDSRRVGIQSWSHSEDLHYNWQYGVFNQRLVQDEGEYFSNHLQGEIAGRFANTLWYDETSGGRGYAHLAISGTVAHPDGTAQGDPDPIGSGRDADEARFRTRPEARTSSRWIDTRRISGANWYEMANLEGVLNVGATQIVGEYMNMWLQRDNGTTPNDSDLYFHGGYVYVSYFLTGEHMPWDRRTGQLDRVKPFENFFLVRTEDGEIGRGWGGWQVAARYSTADFSNQDIAGGVGESVTLGLNWYWNAYARMQFNYIYGRITDHAPVAGFTSGDYQVLGTRLMVDF